jgi:hypothetical protein
MLRKAWSIISHRKMRIRAIMKGTTETRKDYNQQKDKERVNREHGRPEEGLTDNMSDISRLYYRGPRHNAFKLLVPKVSVSAH